MGIDHFAQIDAVLPSQFSGNRRPRAPELRLMIAVFEDALDCLAKHSSAVDAQNRRLVVEARQWFLAAEETEWPYSFEGICRVLDLDSAAVLQNLRGALLEPSSDPGTGALLSSRA